ncbi:MAG: cytochrome P450 [Ramlibacter sp.]|nr:cytochrome P450 [Ramlibacter sp.]
MPSDQPREGFIPPRPGYGSKAALLGGLFARDGRSMLNLLTERAYSVRMGVGRIASKALFLVNAPETVREVMVDRVAAFPKHHYLAEILQPLIGISLFNANGAAWQQQRRLVDQAFAQAGLRRAFPLMQAAVGDLLWRLGARDRSQPWDAEAAMCHVTADIIFRTILSTPLDAAQAHAIYTSFRGYQENAQRIMGLSVLRVPTWLHRARCLRQGQAIRASFSGLIHERFRAIARGESGLPDDMLAALIQARDPQTGARLTVDEVVDQVGTLFLAGHETSASTLAWSLYLLACQPQLQEALRSEIELLWQGREPEFGDTRHLARTHDVFRETLRLYPPIAFYLREAGAADCLRGKPVAAGDMVSVSPWLVHRHRDFWERPDEFDPGRFNTECGRASARASYLPFGLGPRACHGAAFATQESVLILAQVVRHFRIEPMPGHVPRPTARLTLRSANGVLLRLVPREPGP